MATTITYKDSVIATATNTTKTLNTQGKYMEGNVIIKDEGFPVRGVFYVYHTSSCQIERIEIPDANNWTIDLTKLVPEGYLYGGYFSYYGTSSGANGASKQFTYQDLEQEEFVNNLWLDASGTPYDGGKANVFQPSLAYTDDGTSLSPTINQVYYLAEVPNDYLRQIVETYGPNNTINDLIIYICLDRGKTSFLGISIPDLYDTKRFVLTVNIDGTLYTANKLFNEKVYIDKTISIPRGYLTMDLVDVSQYPDNSDIAITPTWITLDGVQVFGAVTYTVNLGSHTTATYTITPSLYAGKKAISRSNAYPLESQTITPSTSQQIVAASSSSFYGLKQVIVNAIPSNYIVPTGTLNITENGTKDVTSYASVSVNIASTINNQNKSVTPTESSQSITYDSGYSGLGTVTVEAVPSSYVGSNVARNTAGDISYDWETGKVSAPSGYYAADATYNIPESSSKPTPYIEFEPATGLIKASTTYDEDHCGYFSTGTQSAQLQLPTVATSTITPTESRQLAVGMGNYVTGPVYVGAIDSSYVGSSITRRSSADLTASGSAVTAPAGYYSADASKTIPDATLKLSDAVINLDGSIEAEVKATSGGYVSQGNHYLTVEDVVTMKGAQTYYPSSSDQSISEWQYLIGAQTIKGVTYSGLDASNIKKDVVVKIGDSADDDRIVSVTGTYEGGGGGGVNWGEIGSTSVTPSVRNLYAALADSSIEFGSFTLASTPTKAFVDLFTLTSIIAPCKGIVIIDDAFYQGASGLPNNGNSDAISYMHFSKAFLNPAKETALASAYPCYGFMIWGVSQTITSAQAGGSIGANPFDGTTGIARGYFQWNGQTLQWKSQYGGQQYTTFVAGRTYRWIAY